MFHPSPRTNGVSRVTHCRPVVYLNDQAANDPHKSHRVSRESTGCGLDESTTVVCTCGWRGQPRFGWQDRQSALLRDDELAHRH